MLTWDDVPSLPVKVTVDPVTKLKTVRLAISLDFAEIKAQLRGEKPLSPSCSGVQQAKKFEL